MAIILIKENGSGLSDSNCYCDLADLESAAELCGVDISGFSDEKKKSAIWVGANKYIDRLHQFNGEPVSEDQALKLYTSVVSFDDAGRDVIQANAEAAILSLQGFLFVDPTLQSSNGDIKSTKDKLDVLSTEIEYMEGTALSSKYNTSSIDALLKPYLKTGSGGFPLRTT